MRETLPNRARGTLIAAGGLCLAAHEEHFGERDVFVLWFFKGFFRLVCQMVAEGLKL